MDPRADRPLTAPAKTAGQIGAIRSSFAPWEDAGAVPLVRFDGVVKRFDGQVAVDRIDLAIYEREFFALLGPSGCGKTTLMRMLAGFETPDEGRIFLDGKDVAALPPHQRPVHMMFQSYALFPHLSVAQNIGFGLKGLDRAARSARIEEMLALVKLDGLGGRKPSQLSGGQRQRVALARAIAPKPRILLLDEPLAALDKKLREETQFELMNLQHTLGMTFLIVTHDQEEAMVTADRIAVMRQGKIVQVGRPAEVYEAPVNRYVADFIGEVNLFEGEATAAADGAVKLASVDSPAGVIGLGDATKGATTWIAVRPEKMQLHFEPPAAGPNRLEGVVADIGYLGDWTTYVITLASGRTVRAAQANVARTAARPVGWDDRVWLTFAADAGVALGE